MGKRNRGKGTLEKKGEPGRVWNGDIEQTRRGGRRRRIRRRRIRRRIRIIIRRNIIRSRRRRRIRSGKSQTSDKEPGRVKSRPGKRKGSGIGSKNAGYSRRKGRTIYLTSDYFAKGSK